MRRKLYLSKSAGGGGNPITEVPLNGLLGYWKLDTSSTVPDYGTATLVNNGLSTGVAAVQNAGWENNLGGNIKATGTGVKSFIFWMFQREQELYVFDARTGVNAYLIHTAAPGIDAMYVNGVSVPVDYASIPNNQWSQVYIELTTPTSSAITFLGRYNDTQPNASSIDELALYDRVLTLDELVGFYQDGVGLTIPDPVIVEPATANMLPAPQDVTHASWVKNLATVAQNGNVSRITDSVGSDPKYVWVQGQPQMTLVIEFKKVNKAVVFFTFGRVNTGVVINLDLQSVGEAGSSPSVDIIKKQDMGDGWLKVLIHCNSTSGLHDNFVVALTTSDGAATGEAVDFRNPKMYYD